MQDILINIGLVSSLIVVGEIVARTTRLRASVLRKGMHVAAGFTIMLGAAITSYQAYIFVGLYIAAVLIATRKYLPLRSVQDRSTESHGEVYFGIGTTLAALFCGSLHDFIAVMAVLTLADTAAYIAGRAIPSLLLRPGKSLAGTLACLFASITLFLTLGHSPLFAVITGLYIAAAELLSDSGTDNITIPVVCIILLNGV